MISPLPAEILIHDSDSTENKAFSQEIQSFEKPVNILLMGFDARKGDKNPRCDALHMISVDIKNEKITIASVPRGILVDLPKSVGGGTTYIGNSCHTAGIDFAIGEIEKITGIKHDYLIKTGFSQALGVFRYLGLPTTPTLQYLRNRRYGIGDYQRSRNQAIFLKDMFVSKFEHFAKLPKAVKYIAYKTVDTDLPYETLHDLINEVLSSKLYKNPDNIKTVQKPETGHKPKELFYDENEFSASDSWQTDGEYQDYQNGMITYLQDLANRGKRLVDGKQYGSAYNLIKTPYNQKLWLQIDDAQTRFGIEYDLLYVFTQSTPSKNEAANITLDFITEMETYGLTTMVEKGKDLLDFLQT